MFTRRVFIIQNALQCAIPGRHLKTSSQHFFRKKRLGKHFSLKEYESTVREFDDTPDLEKLELAERAEDIVSNKDLSSIVAHEEVGKAEWKRKIVKFKTIQRKHFRPEKELNLLTWNAKEQMRYLHKEFPEEWTAERLAQSFPVSEEAVKKVVKSKERPRTWRELIKHDERVRKNWLALRDVDPEKSGGPIQAKYMELADSGKLGLLCHGDGFPGLQQPELKLLESLMEPIQILDPSRKIGKFEAMVKDKCEIREQEERDKRMKGLMELQEKYNKQKKVGFKALSQFFEKREIKKITGGVDHRTLSALTLEEVKNKIPKEYKDVEEKNSNQLKSDKNLRRSLSRNDQHEGMNFENLGPEGNWFAKHSSDEFTKNHDDKNNYDGKAESRSERPSRKFERFSDRGLVSSRPPADNVADKMQHDGVNHQFGRNRNHMGMQADEIRYRKDVTSGSDFDQHGAKYDGHYGDHYHEHGGSPDQSYQQGHLLPSRYHDGNPMQQRRVRGRRVNRRKEPSDLDMEFERTEFDYMDENLFTSDLHNHDEEFSGTLKPETREPRTMLEYYQMKGTGVVSSKSKRPETNKISNLNAKGHVENIDSRDFYTNEPKRYNNEGEKFQNKYRKWHDYQTEFENSYEQDEEYPYGKIENEDSIDLEEIKAAKKNLVDDEMKAFRKGNAVYDEDGELIYRIL